MWFWTFRMCFLLFWHSNKYNNIVYLIIIYYTVIYTHFRTPVVQHTSRLTELCCFETFESSGHLCTSTQSQFGYWLAQSNRTITYGCVLFHYASFSLWIHCTQSSKLNCRSVKNVEDYATQHNISFTLGSFQYSAPPQRPHASLVGCQNSLSGRWQNPGNSLQDVQQCVVNHKKMWLKISDFGRGDVVHHYYEGLFLKVKHTIKYPR